MSKHPHGFAPFPTQLPQRLRHIQFCRLVDVKGHKIYMLRYWMRSNMVMVHRPNSGMRKISKQITDDELLYLLKHGRLWVMTGRRSPYKWY